MTIMYTRTDEAPMLATASWLPVVSSFARTAGINVVTRDVSLAGRILARFPENLTAEQRVDDDLTSLGNLVQKPEANIIKLPNISASIPQLISAIAELQAAGFDIPDYPQDPQGSDEAEIRARYDSIKGSAVNPVLREGNSDRRAPKPVKNYAKTHPHSMGQWTHDSKTRVATMDSGDFKSNEQSVVVDSDGTVEIIFVNDSGQRVLTSVPVLEGEIVDATKMSAAQLDEFLTKQVKAAKEESILYSIHLKATMMKVSDPVIFGHAVRAFYPETFERFVAPFGELGIDASDGLGTLLDKIEGTDVKDDVRASISAETEAGPDLYMVNSDTGITNLHVPSDVIIDASIPALIRNGGRAWDHLGNERDTLVVIPDSSYAGIYDVVINDCRAHGAFDPATMGSVPNVGLMAQKAEEYGSHDKTFIMDDTGTVEVRMADKVLMKVDVENGDIFRSCQTKDAPIRDWVALAVRRARASETPAVFWLDPERAHDREVRTKVETYLANEETQGLDIRILSPVEAATVTCSKIRAGHDVISVTGNVLRDYLTDLFPILELGTSAKMLSVVPLMAGGGLFETGAGGSAPKHVQRFVASNHLSWNSLGEFMALTESLRQVERHERNSRAGILADTLDLAIERLLDEDLSPQREPGKIDARGSHVAMATFWARALAEQTADGELADHFSPIADQLEEIHDDVQRRLIEVQGHAVELDGYYRPSIQRMNELMRPVPEFNEVIDSIGQAPGALRI